MQLFNCKKQRKLTKRSILLTKIRAQHKVLRCCINRDFSYNENYGITYMSSFLNKQLGTTDVVWNLDALYDSTEDELLQDDLDLCTQEAELIKDICAGKMAEIEPGVFARTVRRIERIEVNLGRMETYAFLNFVTDVKNDAAGAFMQKCKEDASLIRRELVFFDLEWANMDQQSADTFLAADDTAAYRHYLRNIRR